MRSNRINDGAETTFSQEGMAHFFRARFKTFDIPIVRDRVDMEAEVLQRSADPEQILAALEHKLSESQDQVLELTSSEEDKQT